MCGVYGHIGKSNSALECFKGLKYLEYRGYDSSGIAGLSDGVLFCIKEKGKLSALEEQIGEKLQACHSSIGHTRWATHGVASQSNAHPHLDQQGEIALVHNGILENYLELRTFLSQKGVEFSSETDSEVIVQLIAHFYHGDLIEAVRKATQQMKGSWGIALIHKDYPDQILAFCQENSIIVGISKEGGEAFVSSDPGAFHGKDLDLYFLLEGEIALATPTGVTLYDKSGSVLERPPESLNLPKLEISKQNYPHFLLKEIYDQPIAVKNALQGRENLDEVPLSADDLAKIDQILILACGTSWYAGSIAALQLEALTGIPTRAEIASEHRYKETPLSEKTLVIAISQSGETADTLAAMRRVQKQGAKVIGICNVLGSTLMREADYPVPLRAGPEISVCSTKAFSCQIAVLSLLTLKLASLTTGKTGAFLEEIQTLPEVICKTLEQREQIEAMAKKYVDASHFLFLGRQYMFPTAQEAALKLKEISYLNAVAYPAGELKHGPIALIDEKCLTVGLCGNQRTYEKTLSNLMEVRARSGRVLAFAPEGIDRIGEVASDVIWIPPVSDLLSPVPYAIAGQLFAYFVAVLKGTDIDQPRNLAKSVTVE